MVAGVDGSGFVGRAVELDVLRRAAAAAWRGEPQVVVVRGEAGIGKSQLIQTFAAEAGAGGVDVRAGGCHPTWQQPYGPWVEALGELAPPAPAEAADGSLTAFVRTRDRLRALAAERPLELTFDDLHWADPDSLRLLEFVLARLGAARVMVVVAHRHPDPALGAGRPLAATMAALLRLSGTTTVDLGGLDEAEVAQVIDATVGGKAPAAVARAVGRSTDGNPLFVREVARHLVDRRRLVERGGRWSSDFSAGELGIPPTVRLIVQERLAALPDAAGRLLPVAALAGDPFDLEPARTVAGLDPDEAMAALDDALACGLVDPSGHAGAPYRFAHAIVRDAIVDALNPTRRQLVHRRLAEALTADSGRRPEDVVAVAEHLWAGRRPDGADDAATVEALRDAARLARSRSASGQALDLLDRALALAGGADRAELLAEKAVVAADALDGPAADAACRAAVELLQPAEAGMLIVRVVSALREGTPPAQWSPLVSLGLRLLEGDRTGLPWARLAVMTDPLEPVLSGPFYAARWTAYPPDAVALLAASPVELDRALAVEPFEPRTSTATDDLLAAVRTWTDPAARRRGLDLVARDLALRHGRVAEARACYEELLAVGEANGSLPARAEALAFLALCTALLGDLATALRHQDRAAVLVADLWPTHRLHVLAPMMRAIVAYLQGEGDWDGIADRLVGFLRHPAAAQPFAAVAMAMAALAFAMGGRDAEAGDVLASATEALARHRPEDHGVAGGVWFAAAAAYRLHDRRRAAALEPVQARLVAYGKALGPCPSPAHVDARLAAVAGDADRAAVSFAQARGDYAVTGHLGLIALVDAEEAALGGPDAPALRARAGAAFAELGMTGWAAPAVATSTGPLSDREGEVLALLAAGLTNREIAERLVVSPATVNRHVANIYVKLGTRNRAEATAWALRHRPPSA